MKKTITWILLICCILGHCVPTLYAAPVQDANTVQNESALPYPTLKKYAVTYSCEYIPEDNLISISGNVSHEIMVSQKNYTIEIHSIGLGESLEAQFEEITSRKPLASTDIAVKFEFAIKAEKIIDRFLQYAIVLRSPEGQAILAAPPQMVGYSAEPIDFFNSRLPFKGIRGGDPSISSSLGFGTVIVPVYLDRLLCLESAGYMYPVEDHYFYFDQDYVHELDAQIRSYSANGGRVYLQLLLPSGSEDSITEDTDGVYACPNVYSEQTIQRLYAYASFLASRYNKYQNGMIHGMIVGAAIDRYTMNDCGALPLTEYAEIYSLYLTVIANSARMIQKDLDIVIPFSDVNTYDMERTVEDGYSPRLLLEAIANILDSRFTESVPYGTMIETGYEPLIVNNQNEYLPVGDSFQLSLHNIQLYSQYLNEMQSQYTNAPTHFVYLWNVPQAIEKNTLSCIYAYSFYSLIQDELLSSYVISFDMNDPKASSLTDIQRIVQYIDTERSYEITANLLPYFGAQSWSEVLELEDVPDTDIRTLHRALPMTEAPDFAGSFSYVDFSSEDLNGWYCGVFCDTVKLSYGSDGARVLRAEMKKNPSGAYSELLCLYEYPENWIYTPYINLVLELDGGSKSKDALYEVVVTFGDGSHVLWADCSVRGNTKTEILLDMSSLVSRCNINYVKIGIRPLTEEVADISLLLHDIQGFSTVYSSEELKNMIEEERLKIRNQTEDEAEAQKQSHRLWIIFGVLVAVTAVCTGIFMVFRRNDEPDGEEDRDDKEP